MATKLFLLDELTPSDIDPGSEFEILASLTGGTSLTAYTNTGTVAGPTAGVQLVLSGSTLMCWLSNPLAAVTIAGTITFNLWMAESNMNANAGPQVKVERCNNNGVVQSVISNLEKGTELGTGARALQNWAVTPTSTALSEGDRIKITIFINDAGGTMASGHSASIGVNRHNAGSVDGDSWVQFTETITEIVTKTLGDTGAGSEEFFPTIPISAMGETGAGTDASAPEVSQVMSESGAGTDDHDVEVPVSAEIVQDTFTDTDDTDIASHTPELGSWSYHPVSGVGATGRINGNRLTNNNGGIIPVIMNDRSTGTDFVIEVPFRILASAAANAGVLFCLNPTTDNHYVFRYNYSTLTFEFRKTVGGLGNGIASKALSLSENDERMVRIEKEGSNFNIFIEGILYDEFKDVVDTVHSSGRVGFRFTGANTSTAGVAFSSINVVEAAFAEQAETGAGTEATSFAVSVELGETGAGTDGIAEVQAEVAIQEAGAGTDQIGTVFAELNSLSESAPGGDAILSEALQAMAETGAGADSHSNEAQPTLAETGAGADAHSSEADVLTAETGAGQDVPGLEPVQQTLAESGAGAEALGLSVSVSVSDGAPGVDSHSAEDLSSNEKFQAETGAGTESMLVDATVQVSESAPPAEVIAVEAQVSIGDAAPGAHQHSAQALTGLSETGAGAHAFGVEVVVTFSEGAPPSEAFGYQVFVELSETGAGSEARSIAAALQMGETGAGAHGHSAQDSTFEDPIGIDRYYGTSSVQLHEDGQSSLTLKNTGSSSI